MALQQPTSYPQVATRASRSPAWFGQLMAFAVTLLALATVVYLGIVFGFRPYLESQVVSLDQQIDDFSRQVPEQEQKAIATFYSQLANIRTVLGKHQLPTQFLDWVEGGTLTDVVLTKVSYNATVRQAQISGVARSSADVGAQLVAFQNLPGTERVDFRSSSQVAGGTAFDVVVTVVPGSFTGTQGAITQ